MERLGLGAGGGERGVPRRGLQGVAMMVVRAWSEWTAGRGRGHGGTFIGTGGARQENWGGREWRSGSVRTSVLRRREGIGDAQARERGEDRERRAGACVGGVEDGCGGRGGEARQQDVCGRAGTR